MSTVRPERPLRLVEAAHPLVVLARGLIAVSAALVVVLMAWITGWTLRPPPGWTLENTLLFLVWMLGPSAGVATAITRAGQPSRRRARIAVAGAGVMAAMTAAATLLLIVGLSAGATALWLFLSLPVLQWLVVVATGAAVVIGSRPPRAAEGQQR